MNKVPTKPYSFFTGVIFLLLALSLPTIGMLPNHALAQSEATVEPVATNEVVELSSTPAPPSPPEFNGKDIERQVQDAINNMDFDDAGAALLIPILGVICIFGLPPLVLIVLIIAHYRNKAAAARQRSENIARMLEAGRDVPFELLQGDELIRQDAQTLRYKGTRNVGLGLGLAICLGVLISPAAGTIGLVLIGLGAAQLVSLRGLQQEQAE